MRLGRVEVSGGFLLLLAWLNYTDTQGLIPQAVVSCALHEGGHWLAIQAVGGKVRRMRLGIAGAEMELGRSLSYPREALCALAGPGVSLALAWLGHFLPGGALFAGINLVLALFNLLPVSGLDGGEGTPLRPVRPGRTGGSGADSRPSGRIFGRCTGSRRGHFGLEGGQHHPAFYRRMAIFFHLA